MNLCEILKRFFASLELFIYIYKYHGSANRTLFNKYLLAHGTDLDFCGFGESVL